MISNINRITCKSLICLRISICVARGGPIVQLYIDRRSSRCVGSNKDRSKYTTQSNTRTQKDVQQVLELATRSPAGRCPLFFTA